MSDYCHVVFIAEDLLISDLMEDFDVMDEICDMLNRKPRTNKVSGWRRLAESFSFHKDVLDDLSPQQEDLISPTEALIRHLGSWKPYLTIADLIWAIHQIHRDDALTVMNGYLPGRKL